MGPKGHAIGVKAAANRVVDMEGPFHNYSIKITKHS